MGRKLHRAKQRVAVDSGGTIRFWQVKNERERSRALNALFEMHNEKWTSRGHQDVFTTHQSRAFHDEISARLLKCGCLRMYVLSAGGAIVAVEYDIRCRDKFYSFQKAYSAAWKGYEPGYLLTQFAIQRSIHEGMAEFDMLRGDDDYKRFWATGVRNDQNYWLPARFYGKVLWLVRSILHKVRITFHL
jgi:CelD/BcsL family acetyltransferase involved in cellulose biosynthesis